MWLVCCFGCISLFGCRDRVSSRLMFFPPKPSYVIAEDDEKGQTVCWLLDDQGERTSPYFSKDFQHFQLQTMRGSTLAAFYFTHPRATFTFLFSHGNATDIGLMRDHFIDMSRRLQVNIFAYDYTGYGRSSGRPSYRDTFMDVLAAYQFLTERLNVPPERIILYGQSVGSGPTIDLATKAVVRAVILHSPLMSGLRVIRPVKKTHWFDVFPNIDKIRFVPCPVFVIHGTEDVEVPIDHGMNLHQACQNPYAPWWVQGAGHNDIESGWRAEMFSKLRAFLQDMSEQPSKP